MGARSGGRGPVGPTGITRSIVQFGQLNVPAGDNATPSSSTPVLAPWCGATGLGVGFVATRSGSLVGLSARLSAAAAGSDLIVQVFKNGALVNAATKVTLASGTSDTKANTTFTAATYLFVAGDVLDVRVLTGTGWSATTADLGISLEIAT